MERIDVRNMYVVYDKVAGEVASPIFLAVNDEVAKRSFAGLVSGNPNMPDPCDYRLMAIGRFDMVAGKIVDGMIPEFVMEGNEVKKNG